MSVPKVIEKRKLYKLIEEIIKEFKLFKFSKNTVAFKPQDVVSCSYIKGLFKVVTVNTYYLVIVSLDDETNLHYVGLEFVEKVHVNQDVARVLFNGRD